MRKCLFKLETHLCLKNATNMSSYYFDINALKKIPGAPQLLMVPLTIVITLLVIVLGA